MKNSLRPNLYTKPFRFFISINRKEIPLFFLNIILYSVGGVTLILLSYLLGKVIDGLTLHPGTPLLPLLWSIFGLVVLYEVSYRLGHICEIFVRTRVRARTKKVLFDHTRSLSFGCFADRFAGEIA